MGCECGRVVQIGEERGGGENEREKISSAEIGWTAVPPDDRRELKGTLKRKMKGKSKR
jgi:hypothetical protein